MGLVVTVPPTVEPITVAEAVTHLRLGSGNYEPVPTAPTAALAGAGAGNVDNGVHRYAVTFVTADGETSSGDVSSAITVADKTVNGKVSLTSIPLGGSAVTSRKLYRTIAGGSTYLLLATVSDNTTTTYTDNTADSSLGAQVPSTNTTADPEFTSKIKSARLEAETLTGRAFVTQTLRYTANRFPCKNVIYLPRPNLIAVSSIQYVDTNGDTQTWDSSNYGVSTGSLPGFVYLSYGKSWPSTRCQPDAVTITYTAGYGPARSDVPEDIKSLVKLILGDAWNIREAAITGTIHVENPAVERLAWANRAFPMPNEYMEAP